MRKSLFFTLTLSLCVFDFSAFAEASPRGNVRSGGANVGVQQAAAPVAARATSVRQVGVGKNVTSQNSVTSASAITGAGAVRAATTRKTTVSSGTKAPVAARAATQKALNMGTKVASATANTIVDTSCQDAYYGCMDTFCMLDNATGGRCQCSDKVTELNAVLDEIMRIDEQSSRIATEGVEKVQMGEYADQVNSRAKSVEAEIDGTQKTKGASLVRTSSGNGFSVDLSSFAGSGFFDADDDEDVFKDTSTGVLGLDDDISNKTGDALQSAAAKVCSARIPQECKNNTTLLQMAYIQKVKSDCIGYENALKQQKMASQQKLLTAQKAVRDAVLTDVREKNKYATVGECAVAFAQCMQTTAECKSDYTGCVTLAASENVRNNKAGSKAKQTTIKGIVSGADIKLAASTMESLLAKKEICASVTRQCVNANKNDAVWDVFLRNAAPALKSAELIAEQDLRSNCIPSVAECFKTACKSQFLDNEESYDMCLSNPATYKSLCKVQMEPCLEATGGTYDKPENSSLWNGVVAMLNAMKVDACTKEVKDCLTDRCGDDYSGCVGLDTYSIGRLCPTDKLTACMTATDPKDGTPYYKDEDAIREYIVKIAQGLALQIDNALAEACQNAANEAMVRVCGDTESCSEIALDLSTLKTLMKVQACSLKQDKDGNDAHKCLPDPAQLTDDEIYDMGYSGISSSDASTVVNNAELTRNKHSDGHQYYGAYATLLNKPEVSSVLFGGNAEGEANTDSETVLRFLAQNVNRSVSDNASVKVVSVDEFSQQTTEAVVAILQGVLDRTMEQIDSDPKVVYCKTGREVQGFSDGEIFGKKGIGNARFPELTDKYKYVIAESLLAKLYEENSALEEEFSDDVLTMNKKITERIATIAKRRGDAVEALVDAQNNKTCKNKATVWTTRNDYKKAWTKQVTVKETDYDNNTNICTVKVVLYQCTSWHSPWFRSDYCSQFDSGTVQDKQDIQLPKFQ